MFAVCTLLYLPVLPCASLMTYTTTYHHLFTTYSDSDPSLFFTVQYTCMPAHLLGGDGLAPSDYSCVKTYSFSRTHKQLFIGGGGTCSFIHMQHIPGLHAEVAVVVVRFLLNKLKADMPACVRSAIC